VFLGVGLAPASVPTAKELQDLYPWSKIDEISTSGLLEVIIHAVQLTRTLDLRRELEGLLPMCARREMLQLHLPESPIWNELHVYDTD
jgi:hypothetical protein